MQDIRHEGKELNYSNEFNDISNNNDNNTYSNSNSNTNSNQNIEDFFENKKEKDKVEYPKFN